MGGPPRQVGDAGLELGGSAFERRVGLAVGGAGRGGIRDAPVHESRMRGELGADLTDAVAQRDHDVELAGGELLETLGTLCTDVDAASAHDPYGFRVEWLRVAARTRGDDPPIREIHGQRLRNL